MALYHYFLKGEKVVWLFNGVEYYQMRQYRHYEGGTQGFSVRIAKGVYYRVGEFRGKPVDETKLTFVSKGMLAITDRNIYFGSMEKTFRVAYNKIVTFYPYSNGIKIQRDSTNAKPEIFVTGDGWFIYNLLVNISKIAT